MSRARSDMDDIDAGLADAFKTLRARFVFVDDKPEDTALCTIETFCAVALRVMRKTNPSKLRSESHTVEIMARLDGVPVVRGAA